jgi:hypothetical protein
MPAADFRAGEITLAAFSCLASGVPHLPQKFEAGEFSAPHFTQSRASELPQRAQKLLSAGFSQPHFEQRIAPSLPLDFTPSRGAARRCKRRAV